MDNNYEELREECNEYLRKLNLTPKELLNCILPEYTLYKQDCPQRMWNNRSIMNCPDDDAIRIAKKKVFKQRLEELKEEQEKQGLIIMLVDSDEQEEEQREW